MKRAILLTLFAVTLTLGSGAAYAWPPGPCGTTRGHALASDLSRGESLRLLLPLLLVQIR